MRTYKGLHGRAGHSYRGAVNHGGLAPERRKQASKKKKKKSKEQRTSGDQLYSLTPKPLPQISPHQRERA